MNTQQPRAQPIDNFSERLGGAKIIDLIVGALYFHITTDHRVAHFFHDAPMERILAHQREFLTMVLTAEPVYTGRSLADAHAKLIEQHGLRDAHFDIVLGHLTTTLSELDIDASLAAEIERRIAATKPMIFGDETSAGR